MISMPILRSTLPVVFSLCATLAHAQYAGRWETTYGPMTLVQDGDGVRGVYVMEGNACRIEGHVRDGRLVFKYREPAARGRGFFVVAAGGASFEGQWATCRQAGG